MLRICARPVRAADALLLRRNAMRAHALARPLTILAVALELDNVEVSVVPAAAMAAAAGEHPRGNLHAAPARPLGVQPPGRGARAQEYYRDGRAPCALRKRGRDAPQAWIHSPGSREASGRAGSPRLRG